MLRLSMLGHALRRRSLLFARMSFHTRGMMRRAAPWLLLTLLLICSTSAASPQPNSPPDNGTCVDCGKVGVSAADSTGAAAAVDASRFGMASPPPVRTAVAALPLGPVATVMKTLLQATALIDALSSDSHFTLLAPTDQAWRQLMSGSGGGSSSSVDALLGNPSLHLLLLHHVARGVWQRQQLYALGLGPNAVQPQGFTLAADAASRNGSGYIGDLQMLDGRGVAVSFMHGARETRRRS